MPYTSPFNVPQVTPGGLPPGWQQPPRRGGWFANLLGATGSFFLQGLASTAGANNTRNPYAYGSATSPGLNPIFILAIVAILIFRK